ncbi:MAG TPA: TPM domain-containing protein [Thermoanaerobaculia bacterium]|nr:TPM domain-containing protein [Thermoanaerobaculia bacterium]
MRILRSFAVFAAQDDARKHRVGRDVSRRETIPDIARLLRSRTSMLWMALVPYILGVSSGGFVIGTSIAWQQAFPHYSGQSFLAAIVLVLGFFTNVVFWMLYTAREAQPVATSWKVLMIASLAINAGALYFFPVFARNAGYWMWLIAFAMATWALLFLPPDHPVASIPVPVLLWVWIGCVLFWVAVMIVNYERPVTATAFVADTPRTGVLTSYVTDSANLLQDGDREQLSIMLRDFERETSDQIGVAIYPRCPSPSIEDFTVREAQASRFGRKGIDNGAVLFIFVAERIARIEVGYGLEGALPDAIARRILDEQLAPRFARGEYQQGTAGTLSAMAQAVEREYGDAHKMNQIALLWPEFKVAMAKVTRRAWPLARDAPLEARFGVSFFGSLLGLGVWSGFENAARILFDILLGIGNLLRGRRFRRGMKPFQLGSIIDTVKLMVIIACIAGGYVVVAGGGAFGGGGALIHWMASP